MPKMRGHRNQPLLPNAHSSQGQIQPIDHFVCPQYHVLEVVIVVSKEIRRSFVMICICLKQTCGLVTHEEKSSVPSTSVQL